MLDLKQKQMLYDRTYILASRLFINFNRAFYFSDADYRHATCTITFMNTTRVECFGPNRDVLWVPWKEGELRIPVPRIVLRALTDWNKPEMGLISIRPCYIDKVHFQGMQDTSEGYCPVYTGKLYTQSNSARYEFASDTAILGNGQPRMKINPVHLIYIGEHILCLTDADGDGLYYHHHYYDGWRNEQIYELTDLEYRGGQRKTYSTADLFLYDVERLDPNAPEGWIPVDDSWKMTLESDLEEE